MPTVIHSNLLKLRPDIPKWLQTCGYKRLAEVGVREGHHLKTWMLAKPTNVVAVDIWALTGIKSQNDKGHSQAKCDAMFLGLQGYAKDLQLQGINLQLLRGDSVKMSSAVIDGELDFVYLDADHTYEAVKADIAAWWPKVRVGGTLGGHDYIGIERFGVTFGVIRAVDEFVASLGITERVHTTLDPYASWFVTKEG
jgi:hypothetical protein